MSHPTQKDTLLTPQFGDRAPEEFVIVPQTGSEIPLSCLWSQSPTLLVFLRHFGCPFCLELVAQLREIKEDFLARGVLVALISLSPPKRTQRFCQDKQLMQAPFACFCDPQRLAYRAFSLGRATVLQFTQGQVFSNAFKAMMHRHFSVLPQGDPLQMPGIFLVDRCGIVRYVHRYKHIADNPSLAEIREALQQMDLETNR